jgi:hypothetical protein
MTLNSDGLITKLAQGTVIFGNYNYPDFLSHVFEGADHQINGNGPSDRPPGTQDWTGFALPGPYAAYAALIVNPSAANPIFSPTVNHTRDGIVGGLLGPVEATLPGIPKDANSATLQVFAWAESAGNLDPSAA